MVTETDLKEAHEQEIASAQTYYKGVIDFIKWTSTLAAAAILWVGTTITSARGVERYLAGLGLVSLIASLMIAVSIMHRVLTAWGREWDAHRAEHTLWVIEKLKAVDAVQVSQEEEVKYYEQAMSTIDAARPFRESSSFTKRIMGHIILLTTGLLLYAIAQIASSF
jgi:hypothetical protein